MSFYLPSNYFSDPQIKEFLNLYGNFKIIGNEINKNCYLVLDQRKTEEKQELKNNKNSELRKFYRNCIIEAFFKKNPQYDEFYELYRVIKLNATLQDDNLTNFPNQVSISKEIVFSFEETMSFHKNLNEVKKQEMKEEFNIFMNSFFKSLLANCDILFRKQNIFLEPNQKNEKNIKNLIGIISNIKKHNKIYKNLICVKKIENDSLVQLINSKIEKISELLLIKKAENITESRLKNYQEELNLKEIPFEYLTLKTKIFETKILELLFPNKKISDSYNQMIKNLPTSKNKTEKSSKSKEESEKMTILLEKINAAEKQIKITKESINKYKKH